MWKGDVGRGIWGGGRGEGDSGSEVPLWQNMVCGATRVALIIFLCVSTVSAIQLKLEHHQEGHPEHGQRGGLYRFTLDNYDEMNRSKGKVSDLLVRRSPCDYVTDHSADVMLSTAGGGQVSCWNRH